EWSFVLDLQTTEKAKQEELQSIQDAPHWLAVPGMSCIHLLSIGYPINCLSIGASWKVPNGEGSSIDDIPHHPAIHLSWNDAVAYCNWRNMRLPTEMEWEYAARGGLDSKKYPWGNQQPTEVGDGRLKKWKMNVWQGQFPDKNTEEDGYM